MNHTKYRIFGIISVFLGLIFFPKVNTYLKFVGDIESFENRQMANKPDFDINHLDRFPVPYETFFNDQFCIRARIIKTFNYYNVAILKKSPFPDKLLIGNNDWLYMAGKEIDTYTGQNKLTSAQLDTIKNELEFRQKFLAKRNIKFYFFIAPEKAVIYPEHLPFNIYKTDNECWGLQLLHYLNKNSGITTINVYNEFIENKKKRNLYYLHDNHWNNYGGFLASQIITKQLKKDFPDIKLLTEDSVSIKPVFHKDGNISRQLGHLEFFKDDPDFEIKLKSGSKTTTLPNMYEAPKSFAYPWAYEIRKQNPNAKHKILIISDSFGESLFPPITESFENTLKIWDAWDYGFNADIIEKENPEIVLLVIHEPLIRNLLNLKNLEHLKNKQP